MSKNNNNQTILLAAAIVAIGLAFNGYAYLNSGGSGSGGSGGNLNEEIEKGIEAYIEKQQDEARKAQEEANKPQPVEGDFADDDAVFGDPDAPVTIVEFSDYECPFCKRHFTQTFPEIKKNYIDTGKVKLIFRDFPLGFHPNAEKSAMAAECVRDQLGDKGYYTYHDLLFETNDLSESSLKNLAGEAGANENTFTSCLTSGKFKDEVQKDLADGQRAGINGTPGFLINNRRISGAQPYAAFEAIIEEELKK